MKKLIFIPILLLAFIISTQKESSTKRFRPYDIQ